MEDRNQRLMTELSTYECRDATFQRQAFPVVFDSAEGSYVYDVNGKRYLDLSAGFGSLAIGHNHPRIKEVLQQQPSIMHGMGDVYPSRDKISFLKAVLSVLPSHLQKAAVCLSGSQAVEYALKTALLYTGKEGVLCFNGGYHGLDFGALAVTPRRDFQEPFRSWLAPHVGYLDFGCTRDQLREALSKLAARTSGVAAIIVEPVQGRAGVVCPPPDWLALVREEATRHGVLLIFDDVFAGWGRCGRWTAADDVPADIVCLGKALGGGMPLSVCVGTAEVFEAWPLSKGEALHTGTFFGHPLSCRVGLETMRVIADEGLLARALRVGAHWQKQLAAALASNAEVKAVRGLGLMIGIEFISAGYGARLADTLRQLGVICLPAGDKGQTLSFSPALNVPLAALEEASVKIENAMATLKQYN